MSTRFENRPGDALEDLIPGWIPVSEGCKCKDYKEKMNRWGYAGCLRREHEITCHLVAQADRLPAFLRAVPEGIKMAAAKRMVAKAIKRSKPLTS